MAINNESIGIAAEVAIARTFGVYINPCYASRAETNIVNLLSGNTIKRIFKSENIPDPISHIAECQNPVDFLLNGNKTLSVKTNKNDMGKIAPQNIGQSTQYTYFDYLEKHNILPGFKLQECLRDSNLEDNYKNRSLIFKSLSIKCIDKLINMYWENTFDCDYLILFYNLETNQNPLNNYKVFKKTLQYPAWEKSKFSFTKKLEKWNESNTLKYFDVTIGEFQVHRKRDCFKFRFNMKGIMELRNIGLI